MPPPTCQGCSSPGWTRPQCPCPPLPTWLLLNCVGRLDALQEQLGRRDINTTRIYLRLTSEDVTREVSKLQF